MTETVHTDALPTLRTVAQVARWLGKSPGGVYMDVKRGAFPEGAIIRIGRRLFFIEEALVQWIEGKRGTW